MNPTPPGKRLDWVDTARGIGIIFVVYGHALRGHMSSGAFSPSWHADMQDRLIYAWHMPLFFFLAGLFVQQSLAKGARRFLHDKAVALVYPYFLWSIVSILLAMLAAGATNGTAGLSDLTGLWREPVFQYWFLYALLLCQLVTLATSGDWRFSALLCGVSAYAGTTWPLGFATLALGYYCYFGIGLLLAPVVLRWRPSTWILGTVAVFALAVFASSFVFDIEKPARVMALIRAACGTAAVVAMSMLAAPHARWLGIIGSASMAIYVLHTIFSAGTRIALRAVAFPDDRIALALGTLAGIVPPLIIWAIARRYRMLPWLGLGAQPRMRQEATA